MLIFHGRVNTLGSSIVASVLQHIAADRRIALDDVQRLAVKIAGPIEPCFAVERVHIDDQRVAFPSAARPPHPRIGGAFVFAVHVDCAACAGVFIGHQDMRRRLHNLERVGHVGGSRHARHIALDLGIELQPVRAILLFLRGRPRLIGNLIAFHDAESGRHAEGCAELEHRSLTGGVTLNVPVGGVVGLPNPVEIGLTILECRARRLIAGWSLSRRRNGERKGRKPDGCARRNYRASDPVCHLEISCCPDPARRTFTTESTEHTEKTNSHL